MPECRLPARNRGHNPAPHSPRARLLLPLRYAASQGEVGRLLLAVASRRAPISLSRAIRGSATVCIR